MAVLIDFPKIVIGVDFGTTFSGFSFAFRKAPAEKMEQVDFQSLYSWPDDKIFVPYPKTTTCLFYDKTAAGQPIDPPAWGWTARKKAMETEEQLPWQFQQRFKLHLAGKKDFSLAPLPPGKTVEHLIADFLRLLSNYALKSINDRKMTATLTFKDVQWCLTVPNTWDQANRVAMERAAGMAGMVRSNPAVDNGGSDFALRIVLEPEAASFYSRRCLTPAETGRIDAGEPYLVVDCGGGTVDLVVHRCRPDGTTQEVSPGSGDLAGGSYVDELFLQHIRSKFVALDKWKYEKPARFFTMMLNWERVKRSFTGMEKGRIGVDLPDPVAAHFTDEDEECSLTVKEVAQCFDPIVAHVLRLIDGHIVAMPAISTILLVGGFVSSPYLNNAITRRFHPARQVILVPKASEAVVSGSVLLGFDTQALTHRISKKTYAINWAAPAEDNDPPGDIMVLADGQRLCKTRLAIFASAGQEIAVNSSVGKKFRPNRFDRNFSIMLYSSSNPNPKYVNETNVRLLKSLEVPISQHANFGIEGLEVKLFFGKAIMEMEAVDLKTGKVIGPIKLELSDKH